MSNANYHIIGLMSGTSGDGLDVAYCHFEKSDLWQFEILEAITIPFPDQLGEQLQKAHLLNALDLHYLDVAFGKWMGQEVKQFCSKKQISPIAICSHGHTVFHQPQKGLSLQIGNGWALHQASEMKVINDFRMLDVQLGGQGAPLVPIGDQLLFPHLDFCINLGGISNISMQWKGERIAFDCSPFNLLLNPIAEKLGSPYDRDGQWAREGQVDAELLEKLNQVPFYQKKGAKSLGREDMDEVFSPIIQSSNAPEKDKLATLTEHYAIQIAQIIQAYALHEKPKVLLSGGGAYHTYFIERLHHQLQGNWQQFEASNELIEFKEALIFGFLGVLRLRGESNCLASVTHASRDSSGGTIFG
ncbi:anhydro-N-acetylmuramic acid kinase [Algoriphagus halophilus]|uniref:Anhydro-N-acetylmuramic acid kinase n=1 Tax=Algoriphagus halophilus TaxID=226505 RepID=A0A1N6GHP2_9BACT|nr:anhydro-N-acetylmuramic acid kinase [Algoriphagus halophilus]SIO07055.1 anhydro-N-acetylmuramic acid kinase [Algoriphagus halophilus]